MHVLSTKRLIIKKNILHDFERNKFGNFDFKIPVKIKSVTSECDKDIEYSKIVNF